jgi:hypothetical protein
MATYQLPIPEMFQLQGEEDFPRWSVHLRLHLLMADKLKWIQDDQSIVKANGTLDIKLRKERARVALFMLSSISQAVFDQIEENKNNEIGFYNEEAFWLYTELVALYSH